MSIFTVGSLDCSALLACRPSRTGSLLSQSSQGTGTRCSKNGPWFWYCEVLRLQTSWFYSCQRWLWDKWACSFFSMLMICAFVSSLTLERITSFISRYLGDYLKLKLMQKRMFFVWNLPTLPYRWMNIKCLPTAFSAYFLLSFHSLVL